ncbi:MAG: maleylpyruvate isomerase N-terminal domain-containing protein [Ornithinimicrobium sp.]
MGTEDWSRVRDAFGQAAQWFAQVVPYGHGRWAEPALGQWTVRDLVGHTSRALLTVEAYLAHPATAVDVSTSVEYFPRALEGLGGEAAVAQRGRDAGAALGEDPATTIAQIVQRAIAGLAGHNGETLLGTPVGGMRLINYLPTRTFELTVHTCDLASALGRPLDVPPGAATETLHLVSGLATDADLAGPLLLAATGRGSLPAGFSVL